MTNAYGSSPFNRSVSIGSANSKQMDSYMVIAVDTGITAPLFKESTYQHYLESNH